MKPPYPPLGSATISVAWSCASFPRQSTVTLSGISPSAEGTTWARSTIGRPGGIRYGGRSVKLYGPADAAGFAGGGADAAVAVETGAAAAALKVTR